MKCHLKLHIDININKIHVRVASASDRGLNGKRKMVQNIAYNGKIDRQTLLRDGVDTYDLG